MLCMNSSSIHLQSPTIFFEYEYVKHSFRLELIGRCILGLILSDLSRAKLCLEGSLKLRRRRTKNTTEK